jgi:autotransporter-associated beta strand protein
MHPVLYPGRSRFHVLLLKTSFLVLFGLGFSIAGRAQTTFWTTGSANWNTAGSWSPSVVPGVGTNAATSAFGTYTITYDAPMSAAGIASLTLTNTVTLNLTAAGFNVAGTRSLQDATTETLNINSGGVMNNGTLAMNGRNCNVNVNAGGILTNATTQVANNNSVDGSCELKIFSGAIASLGAVTVGRHTESSTLGLNISSGTVSATSIDVGSRNSYATMVVSGGITTNSGSLRLGTGTGTAGREVRYAQTGGTVSCAGTVDLGVGTSYTLWFTVQNAASTLSAAGIRIYPTTSSSDKLGITNSGNIYLGASGFNILTSGNYAVLLNDLGVLGASADWTGNVNITAPSGTATFKAADAAGNPHNITLTGIISGGGNIAKTGAGALNLNYTNTYTGSTTVSAGSLVLGNASALPRGTALTVGGTGTSGVLDLAGFDAVVSSLTTAGTAANQLITNSSAANPSTLTFSNGATGSTFGGGIAGGTRPVSLSVVAGNLTLTRQNTYAGNIFIGTGKLALSGAGSTFTGPAIILSNSASILDLTGMNTLTLAAGQSLAGFGSVTGSVVAASCPITPGNNGTGGTLAITGNLTLNGNVTNQFDLLLDPNAAGSDLITVSGALNVSGVNLIKISLLGGSLSAGTYHLIKSGSVGGGDTNNFSLTGSPGSGLQAALAVTATGLDLVVSQTGGAVRVWVGDGSANLWDQTTTNWLNTGFLDIFTNGSFVIFDDTSSNPLVNLTGTLQPATVTVDSANDYTFTGTGKISGTVVLTKTNSDTLTILTTNDYNGLTTIGQGTVQVGNNTASGSLGSGPLLDNGRLLMQQPVSATLGNAINGTGSLVQAGTATLTLTGSNAFTGGVTISSGVLQVGTGGTIGTGGVTNNAGLTFNNSASNTVNNVISGSGSLTVLGGGTVALNGADSYGGSTTVSSGTLLVNNTIGAGAVTVANGGRLGGGGKIGGAVTVNSGGILMPGNLVGTLIVASNLTLNAGSIMNFDLGTVSDRVVVSNNLSLTCTLNVTNSGGLGSGTNTLFTYGGNLLASSITLGSLPAGKLYAIDVSTPGQVNLIVGTIATNVVAFPGALGFGSIVTGGRGKPVYHVTTLADSGTGSFRDAVSVSGRMIVFDVGGYISLNSAVSAKGNLTIAGQTAPGGGIGIKGGEVSFAGQANIICRYLRIRPGSDTASTEDDAVSLYQAKNAIFDHCSIEFAPWNNIDGVGDSTHVITNITFQNCIIADPTGQQFGCHSESVGGTWSWFYNMFVNSHNRNPLAKANTVFVNNVEYNCSAGYTTHTSTPFKHDIVNNYFIYGPASGGDFPWYQIDNNQSMYFTGNQRDSSLDGVLNGSSTSPLPGYQGGGTILSAPWSPWVTNVPVYTPQTAFRSAISRAGTLPLDELDSLIVNQVKTLGSGSSGTGAGTAGPGGGLYTSQAQTGLENNGYGTITGGAPPVDSDGDGMPDFWETAVTGLDPNNPNDSTNLTLSGYTQLELYLNWLAGPHVVANTNIVNVELSQYALGFTNVSPVYAVSAAVNGSVTLLPNGHTAQFTTASSFVGLCSFIFTVAGNDGTHLTNTVGLVISSIPPPQELVWHGDGTTNTWDTGTNANWLNGASLTTFNAGDTVTFDDTGSTTPAINLAGTLKPSSVTVAASHNYTFSGSGTLGGLMTLNKSGSGNLTLNTANTYGGGTVVLGGTVTIASGGNVGGGDVTLDGGTLTSTYGSTTAYSLAGTVNVPSTGTLNLSPRMTLNGLSGGGVLNLNVSGTPFNYENFDGSGYGAFTGTLNITGTTAGAQLTLDFNGGAFDGVLSNAVLNLDNVTAIGRHNSTGNSWSIGALNGTASSSLGGSGFGGAETVTIGGLNLDSAFAGSILNGLSTTTVNKIGTGSLTLGGANNFSGGLNINAGTVLVNGSTTAGAVTVASAATLGGSGSIGGPVTLQSGASLKPAGTFTTVGNLSLLGAKLYFDLANVATTGSPNDLVSISGGILTLSGTSTVIANYLNGYLTNGTYTLISGGSSTTGSAANLVWSGPVGTRQTVSFNTATPGTVLLNVVGPPPASLVWSGTNGNNWDLSTTNWLNAGVADKFYNVDSVLFNDTAANGNVNVAAAVLPGTIVVSNNATAYTIGGGVIGGTGALLKSGNGTLTMSGSNTFSGAVISGGTVLFTNDIANAAGLGTGTITLNGGTLAMYDNNTTFNSATWNLVIPASATGTLLADSRSDLYGSLAGGGVFNFRTTYVRTSLYGDWSAFTGRINVFGGGEFRVLNLTGYPAAAINLSNNVTADFQGTVDPGGTALAIGELSGVSSAELLGGTATNGEVLTWVIGGNNTDATFAGVIGEQDPNANTAIQKVGAGTWTLTGNNSYNGGTAVSGGTLLVNNATGSATGSGDIEVLAGAMLAGTGTIGGSATIDNNAALRPGNPAGTLTITNNLTLNDNSLLPFALGTNSSTIVVGGNLFLTGQISVTDAGGFGAGTYTLFTCAGTITFDSYVLASAPAGYNYTIDTTTPGVVKLVVTPIAPPSFGNVNLSGGNLTLTGSNGTPFNYYYVQQSSNLTSWVNIATNQFDSNGGFTFTTNAPAGSLQNFYRLQLP